MSATPAILVIDNYDSFVYNLVQYLSELGATVSVHRNDEISASELEALHIDGVLISPGPGHPRDAGNCVAIVRSCAQSGVPLLGVCLGHQALAEAYGASVLSAPELLHGRASLVEHDGLGVFKGVANPLVVGRYHSLVVVEENLPNELVVSARSNGLIMGIRHRSLALEGVQFHPESVLTQDGYLMLANWLESCGATDVVAKAQVLGRRADDVRSALPRPHAS
jgi:para-aminobenzoate synthetase component 2